MSYNITFKIVFDTVLQPEVSALHHKTFIEPIFQINNFYEC